MFLILFYYIKFAKTTSIWSITCCINANVKYLTIDHPLTCLILLNTKMLKKHIPYCCFMSSVLQKGRHWLNLVMAPKCGRIFAWSLFVCFKTAHSPIYIFMGEWTIYWVTNFWILHRMKWWVFNWEKNEKGIVSLHKCIGYGGIIQYIYLTCTTSPYLCDHLLSSVFQYLQSIFCSVPCFIGR